MWQLLLVLCFWLYNSPSTYWRTVLNCSHGLKPFYAFFLVTVEQCFGFRSGNHSALFFTLSICRWTFPAWRWEFTLDVHKKCVRELYFIFVLGYMDNLHASLPICHKPGGGTRRKIGYGVCGPLPKTLTLFMTKICDFPYPIYDQTKNLIPYLWPDPVSYTHLTLPTIYSV